MKKRFSKIANSQWLLLLGLWLQLSNVDAREIVDMAGRSVTVPDRIERVYASAPPLSVLLHAVAPDTMIGLSLTLQDEGKRFLPPPLASLPVLGGVFGMGPSLNHEELLALKPDIALAWKSPFIDQAMIERSLSKSGLPVVFVSLDALQDWPAALRFTGKLLGHPERAELQAQYIGSRLQQVTQVLAGIPEAEMARVYYAESPTGLASDCDRSFHTEAIALAGGYNVYRCQPQSHKGMDAISLEQIIAYDPQIILAQDPAFAEKVLADPVWQNVRAVREGRVYAIPRWPHNWLDRPPSLMRALGIQWLANLFYPQRFALDLRRETRDFYRLFIGVELSDADLDVLLKQASR